MSIDSFHMLECHYQWPPLRGRDNGHIYTAEEPLREVGANLSNIRFLLPKFTKEIWLGPQTFHFFWYDSIKLVQFYIVYNSPPPPPFIKS